MATTAKKKAAERARAEAALRETEGAPEPVVIRCNCLVSIRGKGLHAIGCPRMGIDD